MHKRGSLTNLVLDLPRHLCQSRPRRGTGLHMRPPQANAARLLKRLRGKSDRQPPMTARRSRARTGDGRQRQRRSRRRRGRCQTSKAPGPGDPTCRSPPPPAPPPLRPAEPSSRAGRAGRRDRGGRRRTTRSTTTGRTGDMPSAAFSSLGFIHGARYISALDRDNSDLDAANASYGVSNQQPSTTTPTTSAWRAGAPTPATGAGRRRTAQLCALRGVRRRR